MEWDTGRLSRIIEAAQGKRPVDLCLRNLRVVNVLSGRVEQADLAVFDGFIVGWGRYEATEYIDADGMYAAPGFIDGHAHIESSLLSPSRFCEAVVPWGTSAVIADPHEIANVLGLDGVRYFLEATEGLPLDVYLNLPSCVPATPLETAGARLGAVDLHSLIGHPRVLGLAEMMNFPGVLAGFPDVLDKLALFQDRRIDGHAPLLADLALNAYIASGVASDHECTRESEAREKLSKGMAIMIREGSQSKDLSRLLPIVDDQTWPHCMFVSDDRHPDDLLWSGHMNVIVNRAVEEGMQPVRALTLASLTAARHFRLSRRGAIAPGYLADFNLSPTLSPWVPQRVFKNGKEVAREGRLLLDPASWPEPPVPPSPMAISRLCAEDLAVPLKKGDLRIVGVMEGTLLTRRLTAPPKAENGLAVADPERDILKLAVYNRYIPDRPPAVAFVQGFGIRKGAIAVTVAHDSHNLIAVGASDEDILRVVDAVRNAGGGMAVGAMDSPLEILPLPIAGLMSDQPAPAVVERFKKLMKLASDWGSSLRNPFMALSFLALPVIPELKLTDLGLVNVTTFSFVPLFESE